MSDICSDDEPDHNSASNRPGRRAGDINPETVHHRGPMPLTKPQRERARFLRFELDLDWSEISADLGRSEQDIRHSLANARTVPSHPRKRVTENVSLAAHERLRALQLPGEAMWKTINRVLGI